MKPRGTYSTTKITTRLKITRLTSDVTLMRSISATIRTSGAPIGGPCQVPAPPITATNTTLREISSEKVLVGSI